jgi:hypothetical protein
MNKKFFRTKHLLINEVSGVYLIRLFFLLLLVALASGCGKSPDKTESGSQLPPKTEQVAPPALGPPPP